MRKIVALVDFSSVSDVAIAHAAAVVEKTDSSLTLLHIAPVGSENKKAEIEKEIIERAQQFVSQNIAFDIQIDFGDFYEKIGPSLDAVGTYVVVAGTHGMRGRKRNLYSENIVRLIKSLNYPTLVVQGHLDVKPGLYKNITIPVLGNVEGIAHVDLISEYARGMNSNIHILNFVNSDHEFDEQSKEKLEKQFTELGVDIEFTTQYTGPKTENYGLIIEELANSAGSDLIVWTMALGPHAKQMSDKNKENLILNKYGIPALLML